MNTWFALFDMPPTGGIVAGAAAVALFLVLAGIAVVLFLLLKKTLGVAFRLAIVGLILFVAIVGSIALWYIASDSLGRPTRRPGPPVNSRR